MARTSRLLLAGTIVFLIGSALAISRDYQDSWVLEGLEIPFSLFVITYVVAFFSERRVSRLVALAIIARIVFLLIPNLKYVWFQGPYIDQNMQYALANYVQKEGHVFAGDSSFAYPYMTSPLIHILFSMFSTVVNVPVVDSMKYVPVLFSPIYPLLIYAITRRMEFSGAASITKYVVFVSSIPFDATAYVVTGSMFGNLLAFLILAGLILILQRNDRRYWVICAILVFALAATHSVTSVILSASLLIVLVVQVVSDFLLGYTKRRLSVSALLAVLSISGAWLMFQATPTLQQISYQLFSAVPSGNTPGSEYISPTFFEHVSANMLSALRSFIVAYGASVFFLILTSISLAVLLKMRRRLTSSTKFLFLFESIILLFMASGYVMKLGTPRALNVALLFSPVFLGVLFFHIHKYVRARALVLPLICASIILLSTIELYGCQPLVPPASDFYKGLPSDVPSTYVGYVNSIYQRQMIYFAVSHVKGRMACTGPTINQIIGLAGIDYSRSVDQSANLVAYYPPDKTQKEQTYDYFLVNLPGKSGILSVEANLRTPTLILEAIYNSSIVYTNGESYVLGHSYSR